MKKIIFVLLVIVNCLPVIARQYLTLETGVLNGTIEATAPFREITEYSSGYDITYVFKKARLDKDHIYTDAFFWHIDGFGQTISPLEASVPIRNDRFAIPVGKRASVSIILAEYKDFDFALAPGRTPLLENSNEFHSLDNVSPVAVIDKWVPASAVSESGIQRYRGNDILYVQITPVLYNSKTKKVRAFTKIVYRVTFYDDSTKTLSSMKEPKPGITANDPFFANCILNASNSPNRIFPGTGAELHRQDYLIVSVNKYAEAVEKFAEWKRMMGYNVHVSMKEQWTCDEVRQTIGNTISAYPLLYYLCIIGDHQDIPAEARHFIGKEEIDYVTDHYYTCLDGEDDFTPDLGRGRLSVSSADEAMTVVNKIISYERDPVLDNDFYTNATHVAVFEDKLNLSLFKIPDGREDRDMTFTSEQIRNYLLEKDKSIRRIYLANDEVNPQYWNLSDYGNGEEIPSELRRPVFDWNGTKSDIQQAIRDGSFYLLVNTHGDFDGWAGFQFKIRDIEGNVYDGKLPVVFSIACSTGAFKGQTSLSEAFLRKKNGGAVSFYGYTERSYSYLSPFMTVGMFDAIWPQPGIYPEMEEPEIVPPLLGMTVRQPVYELGAIMNQGINRLLELNTLTIDEVEKNKPYYMSALIHCFGDPAMKFRTERPTSFSNLSIQRSDSGILVTLGVGTGNITFYDHSTGDVLCYNGNTAAYDTSNSKYVSVTITGTDKIPHIDEGVHPGTLSVQNRTITGKNNLNADLIRIGSEVDSRERPGKVIFESGLTNILGGEIRIYPGTEIKSGAVVEMKTKNK